MKRRQVGRPAEFKNRKGLVVLLEADELAALHRRCELEDVSASHFVRRLIQKALGRRRGRESTS